MTLDNQQIENTLCFQSELGVVTSADCLALADALTAWVVGTYFLQLPSAVLGQYTSVRAVDVANGPGADFSFFGAAGEIADDPMPNEVTLSVSFRTATTGRGSRGRNYVAALPRANVLGNVVDGAHIASLIVAYQGINAAISATGFVHSVFHRFSGFTIVDGKKVPTPLTVGVAQPVTSYVVADTIVDAQRRRGPGRGR
jgi:hypothetical protein